MSCPQDDAETELGESVVEEVRAVREALDLEVGHDVVKLAEAARRVGEEVRRQYGMTVATTPAENSARARISRTQEHD